MSLEGLKVLLAEDNPTNQMVAVQMLESLGAEVTLAIDGAEALEILQDRYFDVALIDIEMPRISGIDLIRQLRADNGAVNSMPMIALTAYVMREHRAAIDEAGADGIIAKPILSIEEFGREIEGYMQNRARKHAPAPKQAPRVSAVDVSASIDLDVFQRLCSAFDQKGLKELIEKVCIDIESAADRAVRSVEAMDMPDLRASTHILISVAGAIGATRLQWLAQCLNSAGHATDTESIRTHGPELEEEARRVLGFVRSILEE